MTYSFVSEKLLEKVNLDTKNSYKIVNSISPELQLIRQSIVPSLLEKAFVNQKIPFDKFALYEMNKVYQKEWGMDADGVPVEKMRMGFVLAERKTQGTAYYKAKYFAEKLLDELNIVVEFKPLKSDMAEAKPYEKKRAAEIYAGEVLIGFGGEFKTKVRNNFKLNEYLAGFELDFDKLVEFAKPTREVNIVSEKDKRDLTVSTNKTYGELIKKIKEILATNNLEAKITPISIYQPDNSDVKNISVHLEFVGKIDESIMTKLENI